MNTFKIKKSVFYGFLLGALFLWVAPVTAENLSRPASPPVERRGAGDGERWAVVIGVEKYKSPIPTLTSPIKDAKAFYEFLKSEQGGNFKDSHIRYLNGSGVTRDSIATALGTFLNQVDEKDYVVVYLSGHGMVESRHTTRYYFLPTEADANNLSGTAVRMNNIYQWIEESPAAKKLIIADVCHSGAISATGALTKGNNPVHDYLKKLAKSYEGLGVFTSSRATQLSQEFSNKEKRKDPEKEKSVFTYYLLQALGPRAEEIDDQGKRDGVIDIKEAFEWVREKVRKHTGSEQIPDFKGDLEIGIPLAVVSQNAIEQVKIVPPTANKSRSSTANNTIQLELEKEFWSSIKQSKNPQDFKDYMTKFGKNGFFYSLAKRKYDALTKNATVAPSNQTTLRRLKPLASSTSRNTNKLRRLTPPGTGKIPAGKFWMGADPEVGFKECQKYSKDCKRSEFENESPRHEVYLDTFYMDKYEVTQKSFERVMGHNPSRIKGDNLPVDSVTWAEAKEYCEKGKRRLPTEAEWEKAAKGGEDFIYPWGNSYKEGYSNSAYCGADCQRLKSLKEEGAVSAAMVRTGAIPVGSYKPNGYGLYDMAGNVWEWVADWYAKDAYKSHEQENPHGPSGGRYKVLRGGSWSYFPEKLRAADRNWNFPSVRYNFFGFRCVQ